MHQLLKSHNLLRESGDIVATSWAVIWNICCQHEQVKRVNQTVCKSILPVVLASRCCCAEDFSWVVVDSNSKSENHISCALTGPSFPFSQPNAELIVGVETAPKKITLMNVWRAPVGEESSFSRGKLHSLSCRITQHSNAALGVRGGCNIPSLLLALLQYNSYSSMWGMVWTADQVRSWVKVWIIELRLPCSLGLDKPATDLMEGWGITHAGTHTVSSTSLHTVFKLN